MDNPAQHSRNQTIKREGLDGRAGVFRGQEQSPQNARKYVE
jgi:hypothetical protein